jgi:small subunit ribosomal protein S8
MTDHISDMLTRIRNGQRAKLSAVTLHPASPKSCFALLEILRDEGYIRGFRESYSADKNQRTLQVLLKYGPQGEPAIRSIFRVSTPGRRLYSSTRALWQPKNTMGLFVLSTPCGLLTDRDARRLNAGGEVLFGVY